MYGHPKLEEVAAQEIGTTLSPNIKGDSADVIFPTKAIGHTRAMHEGALAFLTLQLTGFSPLTLLRVEPNLHFLQPAHLLKL